MHFSFYIYAVVCLSVTLVSQEVFVSASVINTEDAVKDVPVAEPPPAEVVAQEEVRSDVMKQGKKEDFIFVPQDPDEEGFPTYEPRKPPFADVTMEEVIANASEDASKAIKEIKSKLDDVVHAQGRCQKEKSNLFNPYDPTIKPCFDITSSQSVLDQICSKITSLESTVGKIRYGNPVVNHDVSSDQHENEVQSLREEIDRLKRSSAFSASRNFVINGNEVRQKLKEMTSNVNTDLSFDANTGLYKVPFDGTYHFSLSVIKTLEEANVEACLMVDGISMASAAGKQQQASAALVVTLNEGQTVWTDVAYGDVNPECNVTFTFSGFLLQ